ncbi:MAG: metal-dependent hydrolase [Bacilli bacterium]
MEKKTHVMCANLVSLYLMKPDNISELLITCGVASLGGLVPDVDLKDSTSDKLFDRLMTSLITIVLMSFFIKYFFDIDLYCKIKEYDIFSYLISTCLFIVMAYFGSKSSHRSFTHSILGLFIYTGILFYGFGFNVVIPYFVSHLSHIVLDLFNKKGIALFYPSRFRFSLDLCESNGKVNKFLFILFSVLIVLYLVLLGMDS